MTISPTGIVPEWTIGDRLRKARELTGLDRSAFADAVGVTRNTVTKYETHDKAPKRLLLKAWALRCGVSTAWLESGVAPTGPTPDDGIYFHGNTSSHTRAVTADHDARYTPRNQRAAA